jgi:nuclear transport factor 2 (NTF2) superfamily protein
MVVYPLNKKKTHYDKRLIHRVCGVNWAFTNGKKAPHSMRYQFAQQSGEYYQAQGFSEREALALVSMDLGHGDGRGRYIRQIYYQNGEAE